MTNGEKMKQIFPDLQIDMGELEVYIWTTAHDAVDIPLEWWNAEYKEPNHIADAGKMIEPTTKTCRTCRNFDSHHGICEICKDNKCWTEQEPTTKNDKEQEDITWIVGNDNVQIAVRNMPVDMMQKICAIIGNKQEVSTKNDSAVDCIVDVLGSYTDLDIPYKREIAENILTNLPSVTSQPRKGHWIPVFQGDEIIDYRCSCCEFGNTFGKGTVGMNYCPRCGSRNEVEE